MIKRKIKEGLLEARLEREAKKWMDDSVEKSANRLGKWYRHEYFTRYMPCGPNKRFSGSMLGAVQPFKHIITVGGTAIDHETEEYCMHPYIQIANFALEKCKDQRYDLDYFVVRFGKSENDTIGAKPVAVARDEKTIREKLYGLVMGTVEKAAKVSGMDIQYYNLPNMIAGVEVYDVNKDG